MVAPGRRRKNVIVPGLVEGRSDHHHRNVIIPRPSAGPTRPARAHDLKAIGSGITFAAFTVSSITLVASTIV